MAPSEGEAADAGSVPGDAAAADAGATTARDDGDAPAADDVADVDVAAATAAGEAQRHTCDVGATPLSWYAAAP